MFFFWNNDYSIEDPGARRRRSRLNEAMSVLASGFTGWRVRMSCLPLSSSIFWILIFILSRSGRFCAASEESVDSSVTLIVRPLSEGWARAVEEDEADGLPDRVLRILMAACLPFREPCEMKNSTSSPTFKLDESEVDGVAVDSLMLVDGVDSMRSLMWKKILRVSFVVADLSLFVFVATYSMKPD